MTLSNSSFTRSFAIGFMLGAAALFMSLGEPQRTELAARVIPSALAATSH
jgi:hypothetical protein